MHLITRSALILAGLLTFWFPGWNHPKPTNDQKQQIVHLLEQEQQRRQQAEAQAVQQTESRNRWQQAAALVGIASVLVLFVGIILGSKARHDTQRTAR